ncbi:MAG: hypothetical protein K2I00_02055 [Ruminococcus sp.]|nr:hypothetical protein [Ruminococcus sp.]
MGIRIKDIGEFLNNAADSYAEKRAAEIDEKTNCMPVVSFDRCYKWALDRKKEFPQSAGFIIAVNENCDPKNENDRIFVTIGMLDEQNKVITMDGVNGISTVLHCGSVDSKLVDYLNGDNSKIFKLK